MSVYLFTAVCYLLLFVLMCNTLCEQTLVGGQASSVTQNTFELFKDATISKAKKSDGDAKTVADDVNVKNYYSPVLVSTKEFVFALAGVERDDQAGKRNIDILTKYIKYEDLLAKKNDLTADGWTPQFAVQHVEEANNIYFVKCILAAATEEKVYLLLLNYTKNAEPKWEFKFAIATMNKGQGSGEQIVWKENDLTAADLAEKLKKEFGEVKQPADFVFSGSGFLTYEKKVVFALVIENLGKKMSALIYFEDGEKKELKVLFTENEKNCRPYFFPWGNKIIMVPGNCGENNKQIKESGDMQTKWEKSKKALFQQYDFFKEKQNFVTVKNGATEILLFTEHEPTTGEAQKKVNLWMSDSIRLKKIGQISADADKINPSSFLLANEKLYSLNKHLNTKKIEKVELTYLKGESPNILSTMDVWKKADVQFKKLCEEKDALNILYETDGPVGFLSDSETDTNWNDKYSDIKAAIHTNGGTGKATKEANGFTFDGEGVGAKWTMKSSNGDQPYHFINSGFTLVATATISNGGTNGNQNSILGVSLTENNKIGLLCTTEGKWGVSGKDGETNVQASTVNCTRNTTYYVALLLSKIEFTVYVNGQKLPKINTEVTEITEPNTIDYFYFGSEERKNTKTNVTITDVLLYNWPIEEEKVIQLKPKQIIEADAPQTTGGDSTNNKTPKETTDKTGTQPDTSVTQTTTEKEQSSSPSPTTEDSAVRVGVVGVLCFMLFGVFTLLGRYVY